MKKITSTQKDETIRFRATGNEGGSGAVYLITNKGIVASDDHAQIMEDRLGSQISIVDANEKDLSDAQTAAEVAAEQSQLQEGAACTTDDGEEGTLQKDTDTGELVCIVPTE